ncbi:MAG TPA: hypothetical protein VFB71_05435 [Ramlibacter sp.]|nr:hypothetical protein [Ramlibacter sp.]
MLKKSLLILAIAAACTSVQAQSTPAKKELVARILKIQQPAIETMARGLVQEPLMPLMEGAERALQQRVAAEKREAVAKAIQADARKYVDETVPIVRDRAIKLAPTTVGPVLEEKFTEDELKQIVAMLESPVLAKFQAAGVDLQRALIEKTVAETRTQVEAKFRALEDTTAKRLGVSNGTPAAGASKPAAPASAPKK